MLWRTSLMGAAMLAMAPAALFGAAVVRFGSGAAPADIQGAVDQFRLDIGLGGGNNGVGGTFANGFRNINWDGVPDNLSAPNNLPGNFFNSTSPRGVVLTTGTGTGFQVSSTGGSGKARARRFWQDVRRVRETPMTRHGSETVITF